MIFMVIYPANQVGVENLNLVWIDFIFNRKTLKKITYYSD